MNWRVYAMVLVVFVEGFHLMWEYFHGGVKSHHLLDQASLPAISNWWGLLVLPAMTGLLSGSINKRIALPYSNKVSTSKIPVVIIGFLGSLIFGLLLSTSFTNGYETLTTYLFFGMLLLALLFPVYRGECIVGFVLGMTFTFGAILPTLVGLVIAALSALIHLFIFPGLVRLWASFKGV